LDSLRLELETEIGRYSAFLKKHGASTGFIDRSQADVEEEIERQKIA